MDLLNWGFDKIEVAGRKQLGERARSYRLSGNRGRPSRASIPFKTAYPGKRRFCAYSRGLENKRGPGEEGRRGHMALVP